MRQQNVEETLLLLSSKFCPVLTQNLLFGAVAALPRCHDFATINEAVRMPLLL